MHPGAAFLPSAHMATDNVFNWIVQRNRGDTENVASDIEDAKMSTDQAETHSDNGSGE